MDEQEAAPIQWVQGIPVEIKQDTLTPAEKLLAVDFLDMFNLCLLVESTNTLPDVGGWNDQDYFFSECWLIYYTTKQAAEARMKAASAGGE
jgi:hypothetical protein